jgi:1-phosphatidylinositol-3-phosphate 5-kinase
MLGTSPICEYHGRATEFRLIDSHYSSVLIDLAPSYFRYMASTADEPTALAKLLGFYTVEIKNVESGNTQTKADLLVMENLFYDQNISKTFDLKGIHGRKVKATSSGSGQKNTILFDGDWIEGRHRSCC